MAAVAVVSPVRMRGWLSDMDFLRPTRTDSLNNRAAIYDFSEIQFPCAPEDDCLSISPVDVSMSDKYLSSEEDLSSMEHDLEEDSAGPDTKEPPKSGSDSGTKRVSCSMAVVVTIISLGPPKVIEIPSRLPSPTHMQTPPGSRQRPESPATSTRSVSTAPSSHLRRPSLRLSMLSLMTSSSPASSESRRRGSTLHNTKSSRQSVSLPSSQFSSPSSPRSRFSFIRDSSTTVSPSSSVSPNTPHSSTLGSASPSPPGAKLRSLSRSFVAKLALAPSGKKGEVKREMETGAGYSSGNPLISRPFRSVSSSEGDSRRDSVGVYRSRQGSVSDDKMLKRRGILGMSMDLRNLG